MHQMLQQIEGTRSKRNGLMVVGDREVPTLEHKHDNAVFSKRRIDDPSLGEIGKRKGGFLPPSQVGIEQIISKSIQADSRVGTLS